MYRTMGYRSEAHASHLVGVRCEVVLKLPGALRVLEAAPLDQQLTRAPLGAAADCPGGDDPINLRRIQDGSRGC